MPPVAVIGALFNRARFLQATLDSFMSQDYPNLGIPVIHGSSTDGSIDILRCTECRLGRWVSEPDAAEANAINKGVRMATGDTVARLNSDDLYLPGAVAEAV